MTTEMARFTIAHWCVLLAALMPLGCAALAKWPGVGKRRSEGGFDNADPRAWLARQQGWQARANAAQSNCFEALPFFIGAVVIAHQLGASRAIVDILAVVWITLRVIYVVMYVADLPRTRSAIWFLALLVNAVILFSGWR